MRILVRTKKEHGWHPVESKSYLGEKALHEMLVESPSIVPTDELRDGASPLVAAVREIGLPGSGYTDVIAFSKGGDIAIIECKLAANQEIKRKVVGQILEYGSFLWGMSYEQLDSLVSKTAGKGIADLVRDSLNVPDWDEESFRVAVRDNLATGSFMLVVAVDSINAELERTTRFINACGKPAFSFHALEMRRFQSEEVEVLVPHVQGKVEGRQTPRSQWDEARIRAVLLSELSVPAAQVAIDLYEWTKEHADRLWHGNGVKTGSFTFHYLRNGKTISLFSVYTNGYLTFNFGWLPTDVARQFYAGLVSVPQFANLPDDFTKWPSVKIETALVGHPEAVEAVKNSAVKIKESM
ncbi:MAG: hypothetical protein M1401_00185 [Chloroflexi bacterium]|nr:hypothetical protein [Chloroflexota bacterium]MCL5107299.1 hypothetical protein [Chloroflexota bacterium]